LIFFWSRRGELNSRPADYESAALPLSYVGSQAFKSREISNGMERLSKLNF
jgi:hypothetical protein